jgi:hypothetical protein
MPKVDVEKKNFLIDVKRTMRNANVRNAVVVFTLNGRAHTEHLTLEHNPTQQSRSFVILSEHIQEHVEYVGQEKL